MTHQMLTRENRPSLAWRQVAGNGPTIVFFPGYASDMDGSKATALFDWAARNGGSCLLFDYSGCGKSDGAFTDQSLTDWVNDAMDVISHAAPTGPLLLIGSSMGGWAMLLVAQALGERVKSLIGIAAAPDFTNWGFTDDQKREIRQTGRLEQHNPYDPESPMVTTRVFWESGEANLLLGAPTPLMMPVRLLQGLEDEDVPWDVSVKLAKVLQSEDVKITLVKNGDHRLSRDQDIALLIDIASEQLQMIENGAP